MDENAMMIVGGVGIISIILHFIMYLLQAWGLWKINTKFNEPYPWLSWIPVINIYSFVKAAGRDGIWVLWLILGFIFLIIPGIIIMIILCNDISKRVGRGVGTTILLFLFQPIMLAIIGKEMEGLNPTKNTEESLETKGTELEKNIEL